MTRFITALSLFALLFLFLGCAARSMPQPMGTVDIYMTDEGFFVITERGSNESIAYRFNVTTLSTPTED